MCPFEEPCDHLQDIPLQKKNKKQKTKKKERKKGKRREKK